VTSGGFRIISDTLVKSVTLVRDVHRPDTERLEFRDDILDFPSISIRRNIVHRSVHVVRIGSNAS